MVDEGEAGGYWWVAKDSQGWRVDEVTDGGEESGGEDWARDVESGTREGFTKSTLKRRDLPAGIQDR